MSSSTPTPQMPLPPNKLSSVVAGLPNSAPPAQEAKAVDEMYRRMKQSEEAPSKPAARDPLKEDEEERERLRLSQQLLDDERDIHNRIQGMRTEILRSQDLRSAEEVLGQVRREQQRKDRMRSIEEKLEPILLEDFLIGDSVRQKVPVTSKITLEFEVPSSAIQVAGVQALTAMLVDLGKSTWDSLDPSDKVKSEAGKSARPESMVSEISRLKYSSAVSAAYLLVDIHTPPAEGLAAISGSNQFSWVRASAYEIREAKTDAERMAAIKKFAMDILSKFNEVMFDEIDAHAQAFVLRSRKALSGDAEIIGIVGNE